MKEVKNGWVPDFESRYFRADFPYGLSIIEDIANIIRFDVPNIRETMNWYRNITCDNDLFRLTECGVYTINDIYELYAN
ncbi:MAG TPA: hypothetical protein DCZ23_07000 [Lachnospiraceae bacterium]|nr:hypothetical protein [Lachnospiraceae bacterium]